MPSAPAASTPTAPGPIDPSATYTFPSRDGTNLYAEWFPVPTPRAIALVIHGYLEHCGRYREVAHVLHRAGVAALTFDLRGHGRSDGQRGFIESVDDYLDDVQAALHKLHESATDLHRGRARPPLLLLGHSNGGLLTLRLLADPARKPAGVRAAVVSSPFLALGAPVPPARKLMAVVASRWMPRLAVPSDLQIEWLTSDPEKQEERRMDPLCIEVGSARWYTATLEAHEYVADFAARIDVPTLWLVAGGDRISDVSMTRVIHSRITAPNHYREFAGMEHEVFNERERARPFAELSSFIEQNFR